MSAAHELIVTSLLLGAFVLFAGGFAALFAYARLQHRPDWMRMAWGLYAAQGVVTIIVLVLASLSVGWKLLVIASFAACAKIPQLVWSYLELTHHQSTE